LSYTANYLRERYQSRRRAAIEKLGGRCSHCGSSAELEIDHVNRLDKLYSLDELRVKSDEVFWAEMAKCQLLCKPCHIIKTAKERGYVIGQHGVGRYRRGCRCDVCRAAIRSQKRAYRSRLSIPS
jgi:5-methylcytosine-specific restriction endonuclease McrA